MHSAKMLAHCCWVCLLVAKLTAFSFSVISSHFILFQFLATQNTMAELIGGGTVHTRGCIPTNKAAASAKATAKDADWDKLFENALNMRWLIIDECSTISFSLTATLESFLRKAAVRHPYVLRDCVKRKNPRLFGRINVVLAGDLR